MRAENTDDSLDVNEKMLKGRKSRSKVTSEVKQEKAMEEERGCGCGRRKTVECTRIGRTVIQTEKRLAKLQTTLMHE